MMNFMRRLAEYYDHGMQVIGWQYKLKHVHFKKQDIIVVWCIYELYIDRYDRIVCIRLKLPLNHSSSLICWMN